MSNRHHASQWARLAVLSSVLPAIPLAQAQDVVTNQKVLDELKSIRASLERLEKSQKALLALTRIQFDQGQLTALEAQRQRLSAREQNLNNDVAAAARILNGPAPQIHSVDGTPPPLTQTDTGPLKERLAQLSLALKEVQRERLALEPEITRLKGRIAAVEKLIEDALR